METGSTRTVVIMGVFTPHTPKWIRPLNLALTQLRSSQLCATHGPNRVMQANLWGG